VGSVFEMAISDWERRALRDGTYNHFAEICPEMTASPGAHSLNALLYWSGIDDRLGLNLHWNERTAAINLLEGKRVTIGSIRNLAKILLRFYEATECEDSHNPITCTLLGVNAQTFVFASLMFLRPRVKDKNLRDRIDKKKANEVFKSL